MTTESVFPKAESSGHLRERVQKDFGELYGGLEGDFKDTTKNLIEEMIKFKRNE